ncbi:Vacuolar cation proton exchanger [Musa troglodytarum]|uniref:Vacuolar cation/proton exchanger n=2 Tax=Musa troglodytarum TaxID=320322 RepID=A0A9E7FET7_9LILI|nr:Vacuolar cation proton exchanger [Musa troglodytarum]
MQAVGGYENDEAGEEGSISHQSKGEESDRFQDSTLDHRNPKNCTLALSHPLLSLRSSLLCLLTACARLPSSVLLTARLSNVQRRGNFLCTLGFLTELVNLRIGTKEKATRFRFGIKEMSGKLRIGFDSQTSSKMDKIDEKPQPGIVHSHFVMGSMDGRSEHEFEDESLVSPMELTKMTYGLNGIHHGSFSAVEQQRSINNINTSLLRSLNIILFTSKINILMPCGPLAVVIHHLTEDQGWVFFLSLLGIIPLAERLGFATEQLALFTGPTVGGLLNATFGNATEMIISVHALKGGMIRVVQQSLLGSILSNMLLVLGCAFFCGGIVFMKKDQVFDKAAAVVNSGLLLMAVMGLLFPAVLHFTHSEVHYGKSELALSRFSSCIMLVAYAFYLVFQLKGQNESYDRVNEEGGQNEGGTDDDEEPEISKWEAIIWLAILTGWISVLSDYLVDAIQGASAAWNIPIAFISVILLPIVGNAAEHASAIMFAMKDKLDISLGVAIGSSTQISMFGIPFCVVVGWIMGQPMDLNFQLFETASLFIAVLVVAFMLQEGTSNYFKGLMLVLCYLIVAASFFVHVDPSPVQDKKP